MRIWSRTITLAVAGACAAFAGGTALAQSTNYKLQIINKCNRTIYVARRAKAFSGEWTTRGWIVVKAGQSRTRLLNSRNRIFYLYAVSADRQISWHGYRKPNSARRPVVMRRFTHTTGPIDAAEVIFVHFDRKRIPQNKVGFRQTYLCTGETGGARKGGGRDPGGGGDHLPEIGPRGDGSGQSGGSDGAGGGGTQVGSIPPALGALRGRRVWLLTKTVPARDYCAMLTRAGMQVRCRYEKHASTLNTVILRCPEHDAGHARALKAYLGLGDLQTKNWQRENACGKYHEITIYVNR
ncbi:MAG TPA: DUF1036 domain-containing protein [Alphaproteobacteria bacterium]|nr:DUF1036 domain-containing protein [Alphaproteobacteria bacterium]